MALTKYKLGELIELVLDTNSELLYGPDDVRGMTITKEIIPTKADVSKTDLSKFLVVHPGEFIYNPRTHGKRIGFGYNNTNYNFIISWNNIAFKVKKEMITTVLADYLFLHFKRDEWDREACFQSWGTSTEVFSWDALCDMDIQLPPIEIQQKYVDVYNAMLANQQSYERGLDDLKLTCDAYIEELRRKTPCQAIGPYIQPCDERNSDLSITLAQGITINKEFAYPKQIAESERNAKIVRTNQFAYNRATTRNGDKISIAYRDKADCVVSAAYQVFEITKPNVLLPEYLMMWFRRSEFDRYSRYMSKGSAHEFFEYSDMEDVIIPIPSITVQKCIIDIYNVWKERRSINEKLKSQIKNICPILIKGSIEEGRKAGVV